MHPYRTYTIVFTFGSLLLGVALFAGFLDEERGIRFVMLVGSLAFLALSGLLGYLLIKERKAGEGHRPQ